MVPEFSMLCKKISLQVSMQHVKSSSNLDFRVPLAYLKHFVLCLNFERGADLGRSGLVGFSKKQTSQLDWGDKFPNI